MLRTPFVLRHGICGAFAWTSFGTFVAASPMTTRAKQTASTVFSSRAKSASWRPAVSAQTWSKEQQETETLEEQQWKPSTAKASSWIETMVHPNLNYWNNNWPAPQGTESLPRWGRYNNSSSTVLQQEIVPISITITGNLAVVQYRYTDVLVKEGGR